MTPPAPKASGGPRLARFVFLAFLLVACFVLPQQAAADHHTTFFGGTTWTISDAEPVDEGGTARFRITQADFGTANRQLNIDSVTYTFGSAELPDLGSSRPTTYFYQSTNPATFFVEVPIADDDIAEGEETFTVVLDFFTQIPGFQTIEATGTINASDGGGAPPTVDATVSIGDANVAENDGNAEFTVSLTTAVNSDVTLAVAYAAGTATLATDLGTRRATVTIDEGDTEATLLVPIANDEIVEGDEDFTVTISEGTTPLPEGVIIGTDNTATGTITEDDAAEVTLSTNTLTAAENGGSFIYTVELDKAADEAVTVRWTASAESGDTATVADDLQAPRTSTVTFDANTKDDQTFTIRPFDDSDNEANETFTVTLGPDTQGGNPLPTGVTIGTDNSLTATITDDDGAAPGTATASIADAADVAEGAGNAAFTVSLDRRVNTDVILDLAYLATAPPNFGVTPADDLGSGRLTTVTIPANDLSATFNVPIVDDDIVEFNETAIVSISANTPADVMIDSRNSRGSVRITDNDTAEFSLAVDRTSAAEGVDFTFTVSLSERVARRMLVGWTATGTGDNPATLGINGSDLEAPQIDRGDLTFDALTTTSQQFTIRILDDGNPEPDETFTVTLSNPRDSFFRDETPPGLTVGSTASQTVTIVNNDGEPDTTGPAEVSLRVQSAFAFPDNADGESLFVLNVDKDGNVAGLMEQVTFTFSTTDGTATAGTDYTAQTNQTRTISDSQEGLALPFVALADNIVEEDETFTVTFTSDTEGVGFVNGNNTTTVTIVDQDTALVSLEGDANAREDAGNITFTVELLDGDDSNPGGPFSVAENVTVTWTATNGTATVGDDLQRTSGTATIEAGDNEATFTVPITDDDDVEGDETFTVTLSAPVVSEKIDADRVRLSPTAITATGTITDNDAPPATDVIVSIADASVGEGDDSVTLTARLSRTVSQDVMLGITYQDGTATFADDLSGDPAPPRTVRIPANSLSADFTVFIRNDTLDEEDETLTVSLGGISLPPGETFVFDGSSHRATLTIIDNDTAVVDARVSIADAQPLSESAGSVNFRVSMTTAVDSDVVLAVAYAGGETNPATPADDLGTLLTTVTIDEGETSATLAVPLANDDIVEGDETFTVTLSADADTPLPTGVTITGSTATGTITDADTANVSLSSTDPSPASEGETITFTVNINNPVAEAFSLGWAASDGTATVDDDLDDQAGTVEIDANAETATFTIPVTRDDAAEDEETFTVALTGAPTGLVNIAPSRVTVNRASATGTINNSNAAPTVNISIAAASATEGTDISFVVRLTDESDQARTLDEARTLNVVYTPGTGDTGASLDDLGSGRPATLNLPTGVTTVNLVVPTVDDTDNELAETFMVTLSVPDPPPADRMNTLNITTATATGTILNDDLPTGDVIVSIADASVGEGDGSVTLTARFSRTVGQNVTLGITYQDDTATFADDLSGDPAPPRTVTIEANTLSVDFTVFIRNDTVDEPEETLTVSLGGSNLPPGENFVFDGSSNRATLTIIDNDPPVGTATVSIANESVAENVSGGNAEFTVSVTTTVTSDVVLAVAYAAGTATLATDLGTRPTMVTIDQGQTEATLRVPITNDIIVEGDETFTVTLSEGDTPLPEGVEIGTDATATGTITNDDQAEVSIAPEADTQTEGGSFAFEVRLSAPVDEAVNVTWTATAGTAAVQDPNSDLADGQDITGTATFTAGTTTAVAVPINTLDDPLVEGEEAFTVALTGTLPDGVDYGTRTATATITDNDVAPQITTQPTDQSVTVGETATFTVTATGTPTPTYQWRFEGSDIAGATSASYAISSAALTNAGEYTVVVTNTAGTVTSTAATLTVTAAAVAPQITTQPTDQSVTVGENATFTVAATGTPTPTYQWRFEGSDISGATSASYAISSAALTNAGEYSVVVTNTAGTVTSTAATLTVTAAAVAPQITTQPTDQSVTVGENVTFTVAATGTPTPTYQWRFEGSDISGATSASYAISSAALTNAGEYTVVVTNTAGTVTSTAATLTVTAAAVAPQITTQPTDQSVTVGENVTFTVAATGTPTPTYQWRFEGSDISGATSASYAISSAALTNAGEYTVVVTNTAGTVTSTAATLTVTAAAVAPQITTQPTDQSVTVGENATFTVAATGTPTPTYQWRFEGSDISGATSASYAISSAALTNAGEYTVVVTNTAGTVTSTAATLTVTAAAVAPQITTQPTDQSVTVGENATFTVAATGTPTPTYQWRFEGSDISGATSASYAISSAALTNAGEYSVVVTNTAGTVTSTAATLTVTAAAVAPQITTQPTDQSVTVGENVTFTVAATGTPTPTYQWRFEGSDISGATSASYAISSAALTNAGEYSVVVTNTAGTVTSTAATLTVTAAAVAPQITTQPTDQSVTVGGSATFTVTATGTPTPTYQWRFEGSDISGATSASYAISSAALTNAGEYTVVVTNTAGTVTSTAATLTVTAAAVAPQITTQPTDQSVTVGGSATFTVTATGTPTPTYQWRFEGSDISGATSASYAISSAALTNAGEYSVVVTNTAGTVTSTAATLTVTAAAVAPQITTQPTDQSVTVGGSATFTVTATGTPTPTYQWRFEGSDISGATSASYAISSAALTNAGEYSVVVTNTAGTVTSTAATLTVTAAAVAPQITTQPTDQSVTVGGSATFTVTATGTPTPTYQWRFEGSDISGATSASYAISSAALTNAGEYSVVVTNTAGTVTSTAATLTVTAAAVAPQITTQPTDQSVTVGGSATFTVTATGTPTPTYQWRFEGSDISGATSASYAISSAALTNAGEYSVVVTNTAGTVTSTAATLTVTAAAVAPQITTQPTDQSVTVGGSATFTVTATGTPTPTYQWRFEGSDISGATSASYAISSAALTNAGEYSVVVTNTAGTVTSTAATLTVTAAAVAPQITTQPTDQSVTVGGSATFTVTATGTPTPTYQWRFEGSDISGATSASYAISSAALTNAGEYSVVVTNTAGTVTSTAATLTVTAAAVAPQITTQPTDQSVTVGGNATFTVAATGTPTPTYQWRFEGSDISGATSATYTLSGAALTDAGDYTVVVTNTAGTVTSSAATLTVTAAAVAPQITTQPTDQSVTVGGNATFTVAATGTPTPTYQWRFEGSDISGATSATYTLSNAALTDAGDYTVVVTNTAGTVTSSAATLTVTPAAVAPQITTQPTDQSVTVGENATFTVTATGSPTPTYQWRFEGSDISGATSASYTLSSAALTNAGDYTVVVTNTAGTVTSTAATLTVTAVAPEPSVLIEPRLIAAGTALRRHISRFDSLTGTVARSRLDARKTRRLSGSKDLGDGALATGGTLGESRWGAWIDGAWAGFGGTASGRQADVYGGVDYLDGDWLIGALIGYEVADLEIGEATYRSDYTHLGLYGGARLSERLLFDGAVTYGTATPDIALGDVSASYDARRLTARGALTGDFGLEYGLWTGSVKVQPRLGVLYSRERLGAFTDSAGGVAEREILELGRVSAGPRLTWDFDGVRVAGGARVQGDFRGLDDGTGGRISGAADIGVKLDLTPNVTLSVQGDVDGIGVSDEFRSLGVKIALGVRF